MHLWLSTSMTIFVIYSGFIAPLAEATSKPSCDTLFREDPMARAVHGEDLRKAILARQRFRGDLYFNVPEFRPILFTMLTQMDELAARLNNVSPLNLYLLRRNVTTPLKIYFFRRRVQQMLELGFSPYWETIDLVTQFNQVAQSTTLVEGNMPWLAQNERHVAYEMKRLKKVARLYPIVIVPSVHEISRQDINLVWSRGILPLGSTMKVEEVDYTLYGPAGYGRHDAQHAQGLIAALKRAVSGPFTDYDTVTDAEWVAMDNLLSESQKIMSIFFGRLENVSDEVLRQAVVNAYFDSDHEGQAFVSYVLRPIEPGKDIVHTYHDDHERQQKNLGTPWLIENWNASRQLNLDQDNVGKRASPKGLPSGPRI